MMWIAAPMRSLSVRTVVRQGNRIYSHVFIVLCDAGKRTETLAVWQTGQLLHGSPSYGCRLVKDKGLAGRILIAPGSCWQNVAAAECSKFGF